MRLPTRSRSCVAFLFVSVLILFLLFTPSALAAPSFSDVPDTHPYSPAIMDLKTRGIISGFGDETFQPNSPMSRQQFAKVIVKTLRLKVTGDETCPFSDVGHGLSSDDPFYPDKYVAVCAAAGITTGTTTSTFDPNGKVTRAQLMTMVARATDLAAPPSNYAPSFGKFDPTHYPSARKAAYAGLLDGLQDMGPRFDFFAPATRGEVAEVLTGDRRYGVDYSMTNVDWPTFFRELKAAGRDFIGRYLPWKGATWRQVTKAELQGATAAGVDYFFWFEDSDNHFSARNGFAQGVADAQEAVRALERLGVPTTTPVYYTVDFPASDGNEIDAYFRGIVSVVPVSQVGVYGNYITIDWIYKQGLATYFCQSNAWPQPQGWHPVAQMRQDVRSLWIGGVHCDRLTVTADDFGQCRRREQSDPRLHYTGSWDSVAQTLASWGSYARSSTPGALATVYFRGTRLDWTAVKGLTTGVADVYLDGVKKATVDLVAPESTYRVNAWSSGSLPEGNHMVEIVRSSSNASDKRLTLDALDVWGTIRTGP